MYQHLACTKSFDQEKNCVYVPNVIEASLFTKLLRTAVLFLVKGNICRKYQGNRTR